MSRNGQAVPLPSFEGRKSASGILYGGSWRRNPVRHDLRRNAGRQGRQPQRQGAPSGARRRRRDDLHVGLVSSRPSRHQSQSVAGICRRGRSPQSLRQSGGRRNDRTSAGNGFLGNAIRSSDGQIRRSLDDNDRSSSGRLIHTELIQKKPGIPGLFALASAYGSYGSIARLPMMPSSLSFPARRPACHASCFRPAPPALAWGAWPLRADSSPGASAGRSRREPFHSARPCSSGACSYGIPEAPNPDSSPAAARLPPDRSSGSRSPIRHAVRRGRTSCPSHTAPASQGRKGFSRWLPGSRGQARSAFHGSLRCPLLSSRSRVHMFIQIALAAAEQVFHRVDFHLGSPLPNLASSPAAPEPERPAAICFIIRAAMLLSNPSTRISPACRRFACPLLSLSTGAPLADSGISARC
ncbi:hypothetical protein BN871_FR_00070 [Paenibacillus sp. P22]|nr:hypothetical protein BN871_FR_00070 [Paenibacillus sp. P22]